MDKLCDKKTRQEFQEKIGGVLKIYWDLVIYEWGNSC